MKLRKNPKIVVFLILTLLFFAKLYCQPYNKSDVNSFDRLIMTPYSHTLDKAGDIITVVTLAAPLTLLATPSSEWFPECVMYAESCILSFGMEELGKNLVKKPRPYMYFDNYPQDEVENGDYLNAWPSAHSTMAFTSAAFTSYVFGKYYPESPWRFAVAGGVYTLAFTTAALRLASGNHFLTDVLSGAAIGTLNGFVIPYLHTLISKKLPESETLQIQASPFNLLIKFNF